MILPLTKRQREILDFLAAQIHKNGYAPTMQEIGARFELSSLATVHKHLENLKEKGYIRRAWNRQRSVELVHQGLSFCPTCGHGLESSTVSVNS